MRVSRRAFAVATLMWAARPGASVAADARTADEEPWRIGVLSQATPAEYYERLAVARREAGLGGRRWELDVRDSRGDAQSLPALAAELVATRPNLIIALSNAEALAAKRATSRIPIVLMWGIAPVEAGLVETLARPGGNLTGTALYAPELIGKQFEAMRELLPRVRRVAMLVDGDMPGQEVVLRHAEAAAAAMDLRIAPMSIRSAADIERAFVAMKADPPDALYVGATGSFGRNWPRLMALVAEMRLPAHYMTRGWVEVGGLMSYGADVPWIWRRVVDIVDKISRGVPPGEIAIEQPMRYILALNLKTARSLGLTVPRSLLLRADETFQ